MLANINVLDNTTKKKTSMYKQTHSSSRPVPTYAVLQTDVFAAASNAGGDVGAPEQKHVATERQACKPVPE